MPNWMKKSRPAAADETYSPEEFQMQELEQTSEDPENSVGKNPFRGIIQSLHKKLCFSPGRRKTGKHNFGKNRQTKRAHILSDTSLESYASSVHSDTDLTVEQTQHDRSEVQNTQHNQNEVHNSKTFCRPHYSRVLQALIQHRYVNQAIVLLRKDHSFSQEELDKSLILACQSGYRYIVQLLISRGANPECRDSGGNTPLLICSQNGYVELVKYLISRKIDTNAANSVGDTALVLCISNAGSNKITKLLLQQKNFDMGHQNGQGYRALRKAVEVFDFSAAFVLLEHYFQKQSGRLGFWRYNSASEISMEKAIKDLFEKHGLPMVLHMLVQHYKCNLEFIELHKTSALDLAIEACDIESVNIFLDCLDLDSKIKEKMINFAYGNLFQGFRVFSERHVSMAKRLLELGAKVNGHWSVSPLFVAVKANCVPLAELLCQYGALFHHKYLTLVPDPLLVASVVQSHYNADMMVPGDNMTQFYSALDHALCYGYMDCAEILLKHGASVDIESAVLTLIRYQSIKYVSFLLHNHKQETLMFISQNKKCLLFSAVCRTNVEVFRHIFESAGEMSDENFCIEELLAECRNGKIARFLIQQGADVNRVVRENLAPLSIIIHNINRQSSPELKVVEVLLEYGASPNVCDANGTPLMHKALSVRNTELTKLLLDHGADINLRDKNGDTALMYCACRNHAENAAFIISYTKESLDFLDAQNYNGVTALMYAGARGRIDVMNSLLTHGADLNVRDNKGNTALLHVVNNIGRNNKDIHISRDKKESYVAIISLLVNTGCDVNYQNNDGISPLMMATQGLSEDAVTVLLDAGADINAVSKKDCTKTALSFLKYIIHDDDIIESCLSQFLDRGACLSYVTSKFFNRFILKQDINLIKKFISHGVAPVSVRSDIFRHILPAGICQESPLRIAMVERNVPLARYFVKIMFLTKSDVSSLTYDKIFREFLQRHNYRKCLDLLDEMSSQPMSLFRLAGMTVVAAVGVSPGRVSRISMLPLPQMLKDKLLFKS